MIIDGTKSLLRLSEISLEDYIFIYPTDTVWGIGALLTSFDGHQMVAKIKGTSADKALSLLYPDLNEMRKWFHFPYSMNDQWLISFFEMESTLAFSKKYLKKTIPEYVVPASSLYVAIRLLPNLFLSFITSKTGCPITTTSLNKTGFPPLDSEEKALEFYHEVKKTTDKVIFCGSMGIVPSGQSSSILCYEENGQFKFWRKGARAEEIEKHLQLLST